MARIGLNYNLLLMDINTRKNRVAHSNALEPLATGKTINHLRDSPSRLAEYFRIQNQINRKEQYELNIASARSRLDLTESVLTEMDELINDAYIEAIQAVDPALTSTDISNIQTRLTDIKSQLLALGNTKVGNKYIFSGFLSTTAPFTGTAGDFDGDSNDVYIKVSETTQVKVSIDGNDLMTGGSSNQDIFQVMDDLSTAVGAQNATNINTEIANLQTIMDQFTSFRTEIANAQNQIDSAERFQNAVEISNSERMSVISDVDVAEATSDLAAKEFALESTFAVAIRVFEITMQSFFA